MERGAIPRDRAFFFGASYSSPPGGEEEYEKSDVGVTVDSPKKSLHVTDHLANERTFLAWIRTAIAVMTLGVAINRFALFLMEMHQVVPQVRDLANRHVEKLGIGLVLLGIVLLVGATWHYLHVGKTIDDETYRPSARIMVGTALVIGLMGGSTLIWLF
jgi:putative membrane protein